MLGFGEKRHMKVKIKKICLQSEKVIISSFRDMKISDG